MAVWIEYFSYELKMKAAFDFYLYSFIASFIENASVLGIQLEITGPRSGDTLLFLHSDMALKYPNRKHL